MIPEGVVPEWWGVYRCHDCGEDTRASGRPSYCPVCGVWGEMTTVEPRSNPKA